MRVWFVAHHTWRAPHHMQDGQKHVKGRSAQGYANANGAALRFSVSLLYD